MRPKWTRMVLNGSLPPSSFSYGYSPSWVMQIEPQPMPTRSPSTPASIKFLAWAAVTTGDDGSRERNVRIECHHPAQEHPGILVYTSPDLNASQSPSYPLPPSPGTISSPRSSEGLRGVTPHSPFPPITWRWGYFCLI